MLLSQWPQETDSVFPLPSNEGMKLNQEIRVQFLILFSSGHEMEEHMRWFACVCKMILYKHG